MREIDKSIVQFALFNEAEIQKALDDALCEVTEEKVGNFYSVGNPVEAQAFKDLMDLPALTVEDKWTGKIEIVPSPKTLLKAIEETKRHFQGTEISKYMELKYGKRRTKKEIIDYLNLPIRRYYGYEDDVVAYVCAVVDFTLSKRVVTS